MIPNEQISDRASNELAAGLSEFARHKECLLLILRNSPDGPPDSKSFDEDGAWRALMRAASWYLIRPKLNRKRVLPAERVERLRELEKALSKAKNSTHRAMRGELRYDLFKGWCAEANKTSVSDWEAPTDIFDKIEQALKNLDNLRAAAGRAADAVPIRPGPQRGSGILPIEDVVALAGVYQRSTGCRPKMGAKHFADFLQEFLSAVGQDQKTAKGYVLEAVKYARKCSRR